MHKANLKYTLIYFAVIFSVVLFSFADIKLFENEDFIRIFEKFTFTLPVLFVIAALLAFRIAESRIVLISLTVLAFSLFQPLSRLIITADLPVFVNTILGKTISGEAFAVSSSGLRLFMGVSLSFIFLLPERFGRSSLIWFKLIILFIPFVLIFVPDSPVSEFWNKYRFKEFLPAWPAMAAAFLPLCFLRLYKSRRRIIFSSAVSAVLILFILPVILPLSRFFIEICRLFSGIILLHSLYRVYWENSYIDELTGLFNRRALDERLRRLRKGYTLAMVDVDHFKNFNDTYGHDEGDNVLRLVATILYDHFKTSAFRYGGEEFCVVFSRKGPDAAAGEMDDARAHIAGHGFSIRQNVKNRKKSGRREPRRRVKKVQLTVSAGISAPSESVRDPSEVLKNSDKALYKAKENGRNRVETLKLR